MEVRSTEQDIIPYVVKLEIAIVPIEGWIIDPDVHGPLDDSCDAVCLPTNNRVVVHHGMMICSFGMVIDGRRGPKIFLKPFPKCPCRFPYLLLMTLQTVTFVSVNYPTLWCDVVPIFEAARFLMALPLLKCILTPILPQMFLKLSLKPSV